LAVQWGKNENKVRDIARVGFLDQKLDSKGVVQGYLRDEFSRHKDNLWLKNIRELMFLLLCGPFPRGTQSCITLVLSRVREKHP
jgi:hypothetical protein